MTRVHCNRVPVPSLESTVIVTRVHCISRDSSRSDRESRPRMIILLFLSHLAFHSFARPAGELILTWTDDARDPQYERSKEALQILSSETDARGRSFIIHKLLQPGQLYSKRTKRSGKPERLAGSYVNFLITNNLIVVPLMGDEVNDENALQVLREVFPDPAYEVVGVPGCREILLGGGNIH